MISITFKDGSKLSTLDLCFVTAKLLLLTYAAALLMTACAAPPQPDVKNRVPTISAPADTPAPAASVSKDDAKKAEPPYFGSTYWDELLTSVYYYPGESKDDVPLTHLKFAHREDDIYLCGDQRRTFEPGRVYKLLVTFEPNQPCVTNWKVE